MNALPWKRRLTDANQEPAPWPFRALARLVHAVVPLVARRHWSGGHHIPAEGGAIVVANHISNADPILLGEYLIWSGRWVHYLGKADIWRIPGLGWLARSCGQIPVYRNTERASESLVHAEAALTDGKLIAIYPEGTITKDPTGWPMTGRRGAAHLALATGAPVIPVVQDGAERILGGHRIRLRRLFTGRHDVYIEAGEPIDLSRYRGIEPTKEVLDEVTNLFLDRLTEMRSELLGISPPPGRYDMRVGERVQIGGSPQE